ncbi:MAG: hypothetical protein ABMA13_20250 [Chthoniobacteraceae bacterium]
MNFRDAASRCYLAALCLCAGGFALGGVPGLGVVVDAISDEFEAPWSFNSQTNLSANGLWYGSFRGAPEVIQLVTPPDGATAESASALRLRSIDVSDDGNPGMEDLVSDFYDSTVLGRFLDFAEQPSFVTFAWFPPVADWPLAQNVFGFRLAAWDDTLVSGGNPHGEYYPSIWAYRDSDGLGYLNARVGDGVVYDVIIAQITSTGWFTLGLSWNAQGQIEYYAAPGRRALGADDLLYTDTVSARRLDTVPYHFFSLRFPASGSVSPDFLADRCRAFTRSAPALPSLGSLARAGTSFSMTIAGMTSGFGYRVERSATLAVNSWQEVERFVSNGQGRAFADTYAGSTMFYRVARGTETLPPPAPGMARATAKTSRIQGSLRVIPPRLVIGNGKRAGRMAPPTWE